MSSKLPSSLPPVHAGASMPISSQAQSGNGSIPSTKLDIKSETNSIAVENFSGRVHQAEPGSQSLLERGWKHFKSIINSAGASIRNFFVSMFSRCIPSLPVSANNENVNDVIANDEAAHVEVPVEPEPTEKSDDDSYRLTEGIFDDGVVYTNDGLIYGVTGGEDLITADDENELLGNVAEPLIDMDAEEQKMHQMQDEIANAFIKALPKSLDHVSTKKAGPSALNSEFVKPVNPNLPVGILNNYRNACYRIASIQALSVLKPILNLIDQPLQSADETDPRSAIKNTLGLLIQQIQGKDKPENIEETEIALCDSIFNSELHDEFVQGEEETQFDALAFLELILGTVLNYTFDEKKTKFVFGVNGVVDSFDPMKCSLPLPLKPESLQAKERDEQEVEKENLQQLVNAYYLPAENDGDLRLQGIDYTSYMESNRVVTEPKEVLVVQLDRRLYNRDMNRTLVNNRVVEMPVDGVLDFSIAHGWNDGTLKYGIKSFISLHAVRGDFGHYTAYANVDGKWYHFDDENVAEVSDKAAQEQMGKAYILMFERLEG